MKIIEVVGARPNFMKIAPLYKAMEELSIEMKGQIQQLLVHTGQHYDVNLSDVFFRDLELPPPDIYLGVGSGTHAEQTAKIMLSFEKILLKNVPDLVVVVGDVNSTLACALCAVKLHIPIAHIEAGLRSFNRRMPEEINRLLTDAISDFLFTPSQDANENLLREGISQEKIFFVGNIMIDSLLMLKDKWESSDILNKLGIEEKSYAVLTLHRPANVDEERDLKELLEIMNEVSSFIPIIFPAHPRSLKAMERFNLKSLLGDNIRVIQPLGYVDFVKLVKESLFVLTDSGGVQEETTFLAIPCLTLREETEWVVTVELGTNEVVGRDRRKIFSSVERILSGKWKTGNIPPLWDGKTAQRIVNIIKEHFC
ncbi:UDP-N-acetylglucosamine 2-epimerase (non-hydrolyzing) [bacterium]|nr:UDP-N-acetylglucosamine 2-epimerase (non-hydrolyzing) [bacterium]